MLLPGRYTSQVNVSKVKMVKKGGFSAIIYIYIYLTYIHAVRISV